MPRVESIAATEATDRAAASAAAEHPEQGPPPLRIAYLEQEERAAMRTVLRALKLLPAGLAWEARLMSARGPSASAPLPPELAGQVTFLPAGDEASEQELLEWSQVTLFASDGSDPAPTAVVRAIAAGAVPIATRLAAHLEVIGEDERGLRIDVRSPQSIATSIERLATDRALLGRLHDAGATVRSAQRPGASWMRWSTPTVRCWLVDVTHGCRRTSSPGSATGR